VGANSYRAAGVLVGITCLVDDFFSNMDSLPEAEKLEKGNVEDWEVKKHE